MNETSSKYNTSILLSEKDCLKLEISLSSVDVWMGACDNARLWFERIYCVSDSYMYVFHIFSLRMLVEINFRCLSEFAD